MNTIVDKLHPEHEPKVDNRFLVEFPEFFNIPEYVIHKTTRPSFKMERYGKMKWDDMVFTLYDPIAPSSAQAIMNGIKELNKKDSQVITVTLKLLGPVGDVVEKWSIIGEIDKIDFGKLDWKNDEQLLIKIYFKVSYCTLEF